MAVNKVVYGDKVLIDLSDSTLTAAGLLAGLTAYNAAGEKIIGELVQMIVDTQMSDASENAVQNKVIKQYVDMALSDAENRLSGTMGALADLNTTEKGSAVAAINELKFGLDGLGEPFRVKNWSATNLNVQIPYCTEDISNTSIAKMTFKIEGQEATDYQVVAMIAYEVKDASGQRLNCWPVCQFTGGGQTELSVRWACMGSSRKTATSINAWVLLKHR